MQLSDREVATVIAALRYWQNHLAPDGSPPLDVHFEDESPLTAGEIDKLVEEKINVSEGPSQVVEEELREFTLIEKVEATATIEHRVMARDGVHAICKFQLGEIEQSDPPELDETLEQQISVVVKPSCPTAG